MEPLRIGVLGAARISEYAIVIPAALTGTRLVAVAARDSARAGSFARQHGVERVVDSYEALVEDPEVEAIYNPLANGLHGPWNLRAIAAGKHVLAEKPFASNLTEAISVRDAADKAGVRVMEAFHYRYHPVMLRMMEITSGGELGAIVRVEANMEIPAPPLEDPRWSVELAGGGLMDLGCYSLHVNRTLGAFLGGDPVLVAARGREHPGAPGVDEWIEADLEFPSGATGAANCNMAAGAVRFSLRVIGTDGEARAHNLLAPPDDDRITVTIGGAERVERLGTRTSYTYQLEVFTQWIREGGSIPTDADDAVENMRMIDAVYEMSGLGIRRTFGAPA
ncbi:MAG: Gfo/Idh/MocA family protein [Candidatus Nanopelagicales bacterium]|jgi:predicted dehydrogenase